MNLTLTKGTTSQIIDIFIGNSSVTTGAGLTGLAFNTSGLTATFSRADQGNNGATAISLVTGTRGTWTNGAFIEKDSSGSPGFYELHLPNAVLAAGASQVLVTLFGAANMRQAVIEIEIVAVNFQDNVRGGMTALPNASPSSVGGLIINGSNSGTVTLGALTVSGAVSFATTFGVTGTTTLNALAVTTTTTLTGAVAAQSTLTVNGATTLVGAVSMEKGLAISQLTSNADSVVISSNGTGRAVVIVAGTAADAVAISGGSSAGNAVTIRATLGNAIDIETASGSAVKVKSDDGGPSLSLQSASSFSALAISSAGVPALFIQSSTNDAVRFEGAIDGGDGSGLNAIGHGAGSGFTLVGEDSGIGITSDTFVVNVSGNLSGSVGSVTLVSTGAITSGSFAAGAITAAAIATNAIDADALATDAVTEIASGVDTTLTGSHGAGSWTTYPIPGAYAITVTVTDGSSPIQGANVRVVKSEVSYVGATDASGHYTFSLDGGTWMVSIVAPSFSFVPLTRTVTGSQAGTLVNDLVMTTSGSISPPSDPALCTLYGYFITPNGALATGSTVKVTLLEVDPALAGAIIAGRVEYGTTDGAGLFQMNLVRTDEITPDGATYIVECEDANIVLEGVTLTGSTKDISTLL